MSENETRSYSLTRRAFIDVIWNRFAKVEFTDMPFHGQIILMPKYKDRFGREQVYLGIDAKNAQEKQAQTLVHEVIHVDRTVWERAKTFQSTFSYDFIEFKVQEEILTEREANKFYEEYKPLTKRALNHLYLRRERKE